MVRLLNCVYKNLGCSYDLHVMFSPFFGDYFRSSVYKCREEKDVLVPLLKKVGGRELVLIPKIGSHALQKLLIEVAEILEQFPIALFTPYNISRPIYI